MKLRDLLKLVLSNLNRMKGRVIMTAIGVVIGTSAILVLVSLGIGLQRQAVENIYGGGLTEIRVRGEMGPPAETVTSRNSADRLRLDDKTLEEFEEIPGVVSVTPLEHCTVGGEIEYGKLRGYVYITGVPHGALQDLDLEPESGTLALERGKIVIGSRVADQLHDPEEMNRRSPVPRAEREPLDLQGAVLKIHLMRVSLGFGDVTEKIIRLQVAGVLAGASGQYDYTIFLPLHDIIQYNNWGQGKRLDPGREGYQEVVVKAADARQAIAVEQVIRDKGFNTFSAHSVMQQVSTFFMILQIILGGLGAIALLVAAFGIANTMLMSVYERTREIGLMKAIGASNKDVMGIFLAESGSIGLLGGVGGVVLAALLNGALNLVGRAFLMQEIADQGGNPDMITRLTDTPLWLIFFVIVFALLVGVVSGIYPATRAAQLSPIKALKYE